MMKFLLFVVGFLLLMVGGFKYFLMPYIARSNATWVDFNQLKPSDKPNTYLICKEKLCQKTADEKSPTFHVGLAELLNKLDMLIRSEPKTKLLLSENHSKKRIYVQYSKFWSFPDLIQVQLLDIGQNKSSIQLYSRSLLGYYDFQVNKERLNRWVAALKGH